MQQLVETVSGTDPAPNLWGTFGNILTDYAAGRAKVDLENRTDNIKTPDRVDVQQATDNSLPPATGGGLLAGTPLKNPWVIAGIVAAGLVGGVIVFKVL